MSDTGFEREPTPPTSGTQRGNIRDTGRSMATPSFSWSGDNLSVSVSINLPKEPYGTTNQNGDSVVYQAWGTMQTSSTPPNAVTWGTSTRRIADQTTAVSTPAINRSAGTWTFSSAYVRAYYAVQVTVRKSGSNTNDDQTIATFAVPAKPV